MQAAVAAPERALAVHDEAAAALPDVIFAHPLLPIPQPPGVLLGVENDVENDAAVHAAATRASVIAHITSVFASTPSLYGTALSWSEVLPPGVTAETSGYRPLLASITTHFGCTATGRKMMFHVPSAARESKRRRTGS